VGTNQGVTSLKRGQQLCPGTTASPAAPEQHGMATWSSWGRKADSEGCLLHLGEGWAPAVPSPGCQRPITDLGAGWYADVQVAEHMLHVLVFHGLAQERQGAAGFPAAVPNL